MCTQCEGKIVFSISNNNMFPPLVISTHYIHAERTFFLCTHLSSTPFHVKAHAMCCVFSWSNIYRCGQKARRGENGLFLVVVYIYVVWDMVNFFGHQKPFYMAIWFNVALLQSGHWHAAFWKSPAVCLHASPSAIRALHSTDLKPYLSFLCCWENG